MITKNLKVVAAIPCFNTEKHIAAVVKSASKYVDQVIVVNDGSHDRTAKAARDAGALVINHEKNMGKGAAMKLAAKEAKADVIVFLDGDGQHDPSEIPLLLRPVIDGQADLVIGSRFIRDSRKVSAPFSRRFTNLIASVVISVIVSSPLTRKKQKDEGNGRLEKAADYRLIRGNIKWFSDCTGGFRAVNKESWQELALISDGYQIETEMIYEAVRNDLRIAEVPVSCKWGGSLSRLSIARDGSKTLGLLLGKVLSGFTRKA
jgi:glycosyltransferase involved in cell wall biosynthesis